MTNLLSVTTILLATNIPNTNFSGPSGFMKVTWPVVEQHVTTYTNQGRIYRRTNEEPAFEFSKDYKKKTEWEPAPAGEPIYVSPPPLPLNK